MKDPVKEIEERLKRNHDQYVDENILPFDTDQFFQAMVDIDNLLNLVKIYESELLGYYEEYVGDEEKIDQVFLRLKKEAFKVSK